MQTVYIGNTLVNDVMLGSQRMDNVLQNTTLTIEWLLIGGGGSGGIGSSRQGGGGGAGRFVSSSITIPINTTISGSVGAGGAGYNSGGAGRQGNDGAQSIIDILGISYNSPGGGGGGGLPLNGRSGGSGGGGGGVGLGSTSTGGSNVAGSPISGFGGNGESRGSGDTTGGKGGGANGFSGRAWVDGITYCVGGGNAGAENTAGGGSGGVNPVGAPSVGAAANGLFKLRYFGPPRATGGSIFQSDGYTYHTFSTPGTFTFTY